MFIYNYIKLITFYQWLFILLSMRRVNSNNIMYRRVRFIFKLHRYLKIAFCACKLYTKTIYKKKPNNNT